MIMTKGNRVVKLILELICGVWMAAALIIGSDTAIVPFMVLTVVFLIGRRDYISPLLYLVIPWSFVFVMYFSSTIVYNQKTDNIAPVLYIGACILLIVGGFQIGDKFTLGGKRGISKKSDAVGSIENQFGAIAIAKLVTIMCAISTLGSLLSIVDLLFISDINTSSLTLMRESYVAKETNILSQVSNITSWAGLVAVPALFFLGKKANILQRIFWCVAIVLYVVQSMLSAGRQVVFSIAIMLLISYAIVLFIHPKEERIVNKKARKERKKYRRYIIVLGAAAVAYMMFVATSRTNQNISNTKIGVLQYYFGFSLCEWLTQFALSIPAGLADGIIEGLVYFTHQMGQFSVFWDIPLIGPFFGLYSMPFLDRRLSFLNFSYSMEEKMSYVRNFMEGRGVMSVGWRTAFSYYIFDFGMVGALIFCVILGIIAKRIYKRFINRRTFFSALELIMVVVYLFYTLMMPATCETGLLFMIFFAFIMGKLEKKHLIFRYVIE